MAIANLAIVLLPLFLAKGQDGLPLQLDWLRFAKILLAALGGLLAGAGLASFSPKIGAWAGSSAVKATTVVATAAVVTTTAVISTVAVISSTPSTSTNQPDSLQVQSKQDSIENQLSDNQDINSIQTPQNSDDTTDKSQANVEPQTNSGKRNSEGSQLPPPSRQEEPKSTITDTGNPHKAETPKVETIEPTIAFNKQIDLREYGYPYLLKIRDDIDNQVEVVPTIPPDFDPPSHRYDWGKNKCVVVVAKEELLVQPAQMKAYWERHPTVAKIVEKHNVGGKKNSEALMVIRKVADEKGLVRHYHLTIFAWVNTGSSVPKLLKIYCKKLFNSVEEAEKFSFVKIVLKSGR